MKIDRVGCLYAVVLENQDGERRLCQPVFGDETFEDLWSKGRMFSAENEADIKEQYGVTVLEGPRVEPAAKEKAKAAIRALLGVAAVPAPVVVHPAVWLTCFECGTKYSDDGLDADCPTCGPLPVPAPKVATSERNALAQIHGLIVLWRKDDDPHGRPTARALLDEIYKLAAEGLK